MSAQQLGNWIRDVMHRKRLKQGDLAKRLGFKASSQVSMMLSGERPIRSYQVRIIEEFLGEPIPKTLVKDVLTPIQNDAGAVMVPLHSGTGGVMLIPVVGETAAGKWLEDNEISDAGLYPQVPYVPMRYKQNRHSAYKVLGNSMDLAFIQDGDFVVCVPYWEVRASITDGDKVIVERRKQGGLIERTCKLVREMPDTYELQPVSSDPRHKTIVVPRNDAHDTEGNEVEIVGLCVWSGRFL